MVEPWQRIEPTITTKIDRRTVILKTFVQPGVDQPRVFATVHDEGTRSGAVIAVTKDKQVVVARQYRPGPERILDELPGGGIEAGEDPQTGVMRELKEETGYVSNKVEFLGTSCRDAYVNGTWYYYLAEDCELSADGQQLDEYEDVEAVLMSIPDFIENARNDQMSDPHAVLMAYERLKQLQEA